MLRILQVNYDGKDGEKWSGVPQILFELYQNIDRDTIQFDFLTPNITSYEAKRVEIEDIGGHIYDLHVGNIRSMSNFISFIIAFRSFLKKTQYDVVHVNTGVLKFACAVTVIAKSQGLKTVVHSHNELKRSRIKSFFTIPVKWLMQKSSDLMLSCSEAAARSLFLQKNVDHGEVRILSNGIDINRFVYSEVVRNELRRELGIDDKFVIGHVGRFAEQKNHEFLIDIFYELSKIRDDAFLLLVGQGELEEKIKNKVRNLNLENKVLFLGQRDDVERIYQAMDSFILPSFYEGLPIVLIEAQVSGIPCYVSDNITTEADITNLVYHMSLQDEASVWARKIANIDVTCRSDHSQEVSNAGYSIQSVAKQLKELYMKI